MSTIGGGVLDRVSTLENLMKFVKKKTETKTTSSNGNIYGFGLSLTTTVILSAYISGHDYIAIPYNESGWGFNIRTCTASMTVVANTSVTIVIYYIDLADYLQTS